MTQRRGLGEVWVERLDPGEAREAGDVIAASHADYPGFRHVFPDAATRRRVLRPFMAATARDAAVHGYALVARSDDGMLGAVLWMPPATFPLSGIRKARMTRGLLRVAVAAGSSLPAFIRLGAALENAHPPEVSWYLQALGVHPRAQRRGVGGLLMAPALAQADEAGLPCYLQTSDPDNIDYYRRFGFEVTQPAIEVFSDGPAYIGMTRPASKEHG
ncbi:MAG TPA: GNAT family N-acetyltransferase [Jiangellaceae bacterium]|nr:GNAT family N-acetyltransferase [Jiangellaceae bacterium]